MDKKVKPVDFLRVCAVDPGGVTGVCYATVSRIMLEARGSTVALDEGLLEAEELSGPEVEQVEMIERGCYKYLNDKVDWIVIEDFVLRRFDMKKDLLSPVRLTAMIEYAFSSGGRIQIYKQAPVNAKGVITDARLRSAGLWLRGMPHARDAMRHLMLFLRSDKWKED